MQLFFNKSIQVAKTLPRDPTWNYARSALKRNLQTLTNYYHNKGFAVRSNHILVKLLNIIGVDHNQHIERYYEIVSARTNKLGMHLKFTSSIYSGQLFDGVFYGNGTKEIIIADDEYINPYTIEKDWKNIQAVTVIDHPRSDLDMLLPNGKKTGTETGTATIVVNIPALATQYREFAKTQYAKYLEEDQSLSSVAFFVHQYVLPNMMPSHLDAALFNRIVNLGIGKPMGEALVKHPFMLLDYTKHVDQVYKKLVDTLKSTDAEFWTMLRSIPLVSTDNAQLLMRLPENAPTRQLAWAEFITRLKCIEFLVQTNPNHGTVMSSKDLNYLMKKILQYSSDGVFRQITDSELYYETIQQVKNIISMSKMKVPYIRE